MRCTSEWTLLALARLRARWRARTARSSDHALGQRRNEGVRSQGGTDELNGGSEIGENQLGGQANDTVAKPCELAITARVRCAAARVIAAINLNDQTDARAILKSLRFLSEPPAIARARSPDWHDTIPVDA